eukprot:COSAG03_NODE_1432_length_4089_cov_11.519298_2_plen_67_part_00
MGHAVCAALLRFTLFAGGVTASVLDTPVLLWVNTPVLPNETAIIQGAGFGTHPHVTISPIGGADVS